MHPGDVLGERFEIEQRIGAGGMGEVFRATDRTTGEAVAIKVLLEGRASDGGRFAREAAVLAELKHPGIVRYVAHGVAGAGAPFLAMEWLEGEDLGQRLQREGLTLAEAVALVTRAAEALGAAHARGVIHRDLKPSNLFLVKRDAAQVKLLDFGLARFEDATRMTRTGAVLGTAGYMAPEQARGEAAIDARADVFSLGCVLFECLTGAPAWSGERLVAVLAKILFAEAPRVRELRPEVAPSIDALCARMLAKERNDRPRDGAAVAAALDALGLAATQPAYALALGAPAAALTRGERRMVSAILIDPALPGDKTSSAVTVKELLRAAEARGGHLEILIDGSILVTRARAGMPTDHAAQAARCALAMHALAPGRAMALAMGRSEVTGKMPSGDAIDRAAQMLARLAPAREGAASIAVDEVTAGLLDARFEVAEESGEGLWLRGEHELAEGTRTLLGKATACVGRDWEIGMLDASLCECVEEQAARVVLVTGAAGRGKSRLAYELVRRTRQRDAAVAIWIGRVDSLRAGSTLELLRQALRGALGIQEGEPLSDRRDKLRARVSEHLPEGFRKRVTEFLGELLGTPFPDEESAPLRAARQDAQLMSEQMRKAWIDFLQAETAAHPILLVLEDLHWGDLATVRFLDTALRDVSDKPWMVLALARPEVHEIFPKLWDGRRNVQEIRLKELSPKASARLVRQVLGERVGAETAERLVQQADGNAFYLEELIRAVAEGRGEALPETVLAMVEARLSRLDGEARRVLRAASVFGEVCWGSGVSMLLGGETRAAFVGEWLARLEEQEVLVLHAASRFPGEREFAFRHALLREGAYAMLTEEDRKLGHRVAGEWLDHHGEADPMVLAGHFERGGESARAGEFYRRAAEQAARSGDAAVGASRARLGLACAGPPDLHASLLGILCAALTFTPQTMGTTMSCAEEVMRLSPRGTIPWAQGALAKIGATFMAGRIDEFLATIKVLQETEPGPDAAGTLALAVCAGSLVLDILGRVQEGTALADRLAAIVVSLGGQEPLATLWLNAVVATRNAYAKEDPFGALECADFNVPLAEALNHELHVYGSRLCQGVNRWFLGAHLAAERILADLAFVDAGLSMSGSFRRFSLAWLRADRGSLDEACLTAIELRDFGHEHHLPLDEGRGAWALAEVRRRAGDLEGAEREIEGALALLRVVSPLDHPGALGTFSALRLSQGRAAEALTAAEDALSRCKAMGACGMFRGAFVRLAHAEALRATGADEAARAAIAKARARLFTIAEKIGSAEYKKSFLESVPENARTLRLAREWLGEGAPDRPPA